MKINKIEKGVLVLAKKQGGNITAKEIRLNIKGVQELQDKEIKLANERGFETPMYSISNKILYKLEKKGLMKGTIDSRNNSTIFKIVGE